MVSISSIEDPNSVKEEKIETELKETTFTPLPKLSSTFFFEQPQIGRYDTVDLNQWKDLERSDLIREL